MFYGTRLTKRKSCDWLQQTLTGLQAKERLGSHGPNLLGSVKSVSLVELVVKQLKSPLIYLLAAAAAVSLATGHLVDSAVIAVVVVLNTILGTIQEWRAERSLEALRNLAAPKAKVRRDGHDQEIPASEVVPGDTLMLETGARVAADARVLDSQELAINESTLTGESGLIYRNSGRHSEYEPLAERGNMVWISTAIAGGRGRAVVVATGIHTAIGEIAEQVRTLERDETPLQRRLGTLGTKLGIASVLLAAVLFVMGILRGYDVVEMVLFSVAAAVAAIPEGLPAIVSITLALGLQRMAKRNAIVRRLPAVETLGSTKVICSDKTGTITKNEMTVSRLWVDGKTYVVTGQGFDPTGEIRLQKGSEDSGVDSSPDLRMLLTIGGVANNARLLEHQNSWQVEGDPSEGALLVLAAKAGYDLDRLQLDQPRIHEIPFSSEQKYMATLNEAHGGEKSVIYVKGAPEQLIGFSTKMIQDGTVVELTESRRHHIEMVGDSFARDGLRVIAAAFRESPNDLRVLDRAKVETGLTFVGLWGMEDPVRPEAIEATRKAQEAGIRVVMITGDSAVTASALSEPTKHCSIADLFVQFFGHLPMELLASPMRLVGFLRMLDQISILSALFHSDLSRASRSGTVYESVNPTLVEPRNPTGDRSLGHVEQLCHLVMRKPHTQRSHSAHPDIPSLTRRCVHSNLQVCKRDVLSVGHVGTTSHAPHKNIFLDNVQVQNGEFPTLF
jgi:Ca2+-transporting ATPase